MPLSRARWLPQAIIAFRQRRPDTQLAVIEGSHTELTGPLRSGEIDFLLGALRDDGEFDDLVQSKAFVDSPQIAMRQGHPLASVNFLSAEELRRYHWVLPGDETPLRDRKSTRRNSSH